MRKLPIKLQGAERPVAVINALCAALVAAVTGMLVAASTAAATTTHPSSRTAHPSSQTALHRNLADPGIGYFGGRFYIYGTGENFPVSSAPAWNGPYGKTTRSLASPPNQLGTCGQFGHAEWAPQVFRANPASGYVMYYSACHNSRPCLGVAVSRSPANGFKPVAGPICAPAAAGNGAEAIDPAPYQASGHRYMLFKTSVANASRWTIWAVRMNAAGTHRAGTPRALIHAGSIMEAPFAVNHGGKVWLFVARGEFNTCNYSTDVYVADSLTRRYSRVGSLLNRANTGGLCGPGGASVVLAGHAYYIAYHAWLHGTPASGTRTTYVAKLGWHRNGTPYVI